MTLEKATEILFAEWGFKPKKTRLVLYTGEEWAELLKQKATPDGAGFYDVLAFEAHLQKNSPLEFYIHEYLGHGSFYEWSVLGMMAANDLRKLSMMEDALLRDTRESSYESKDFQKCFMDYYSLKERCTLQNEELYSLDEGFATWLEYTLLKKMGRDVEAWEKALGKNISYCSFFQRLREYERKHGQKALLQHLGF